MRQFKVINQLQLIDSVLMCKKPSGRSFQKAHYRQGDLDGACGAYSIAMVLNILGVFEADNIYSDSNSGDNRFAERRLIKALNEQGLYRDGLDSNEIRQILTTNYKKYVNVESYKKSEINLQKQIINFIEKNIPTILRIDYDKYHAHWIVAVGYELDDNNEISSFLTLDPGVGSPTICPWNGILSSDKLPRKTYGYTYHTTGSVNVDITEMVIIQKK